MNKNLMKLLIMVLWSLALPATMLAQVDAPIAETLTAQQRLDLYYSKRLYLDKTKFMVGDEVYPARHAVPIMLAMGGPAKDYLTDHRVRNGIRNFGRAVLLVALVLTPIVVSQADKSDGTTGYVPGGIMFPDSSQAVRFYGGTALAILGGLVYGSTYWGLAHLPRKAVYEHNYFLRLDMDLSDLPGN
jgi:hypothetical protein